MFELACKHKLVNSEFYLQSNERTGELYISQLHGRSDHSPLCFFERQSSDLTFRLYITSVRSD
jgi:hypothetical protein